MMTLEEIQVAAYDFERIPDPDLPPAECLLWYMLRDIYDRYRNHVITQADGEAEKRKAMQRYRKNKSKFDGADKIMRHHAKMWHDIEKTANAYRLNPSVETADRFLEAVYGVGRKEVITENGS